MIRWEGVVQPLWISRRKAPRQAKELIDLFSAELRAQEAEAARRAGAGQTRTRGGSAKRKATRTGARPSGAAAVSKTPEAEFYTVDHIVNHRTHYNKRQYQVRWENYDASDDTWENGDKLRADVPDIVDAYEAQLERDQTRAEALESAMSELNRDTAARPKSTAKKGELPKFRLKKQPTLRLCPQTELMVSRPRKSDHASLRRKKTRARMAMAEIQMRMTTSLTWKRRSWRSLARTSTLTDCTRDGVPEDVVKSNKSAILEGRKESGVTALKCEVCICVYRVSCKLKRSVHGYTFDGLLITRTLRTNLQLVSIG